MECDERRRAGRVDGHAWAAQVEQVGHAVRRDAQGVAGRRIWIDHVQIVHVAVAVIHAGGTDEDAAVAAAHVGRAHARVLERFPCEFEQQALLGVHLGRFARGNAEERGIEAGDVVEHAGRERVALTRFALGRVLVEIGAEAVGGDFGDGVAFVAQQLPEVAEIVRASGKPTSHPNYCNLAVHLLCRFLGCARLFRTISVILYHMQQRRPKLFGCQIPAFGSICAVISPNEVVAGLWGNTQLFEYVR